MRCLLFALVVAAIQSVSIAHATVIEPRALTWNIVSDREMSRLCRDHGLRSNCEGMAAWDKEFRMCVIWTRSPTVSGWDIVEHELRHCQEGHFHAE
jgi:hypothetical protein